MTGSSRPLYSIGAVAEMLGVPAATLRTWQERCGVVQPERSPAGHRLYSRDQLEQLRFLADQVAVGLSPGDAHRLLRERPVRGVSPAGRGGDTPLILLAERDPHAADFAGYFLRTEGYQIVIAMDADAALAKAAGYPPISSRWTCSFPARGGSSFAGSCARALTRRSWRSAPLNSVTRRSTRERRRPCNSRWSRCSSSRPSRTCWATARSSAAAWPGHD